MENIGPEENTGILQEESNTETLLKWEAEEFLPQDSDSHASGESNRGENAKRKPKIKSSKVDPDLSQEAVLKKRRRSQILKIY